MKPTSAASRRAVTRALKTDDAVAGEAPAATFLGELDRQCSRILLPCSIMSAFGWLSFPAIDRLLVPASDSLVSLRHGLTAVALPIVAAAWTRWEGLRPTTLTALGLAYMYIATGVITG